MIRFLFWADHLLTKQHHLLDTLRCITLLKKCFLLILDIIVLLLLFATDESSCFKPVVDLCCHEENLQDTVELTCGSLIMQTIMKCHLKERKAVLLHRLHWFIDVRFWQEYAECAKNRAIAIETTTTNIRYISNNIINNTLTNYVQQVYHMLLRTLIVINIHLLNIFCTPYSCWTLSMEKKN